MTAVFWIAAVIAVISTVRAITHTHAVHALLYVIVSFLAAAVIFFLLGAPFAAAIEVITYAGAIMVLFVFVVMMLNLGPASVKQEKAWLHPQMAVGPGILSAFLLAGWIYALLGSGQAARAIQPIGPAAVGEALLTRYLIGIEMASMLLLAGLVGAYHVGYRKRLQKVAIEQEGGRKQVREAA